MNECEVCYRPTRNSRRTSYGGDPILCCTECRDWYEYWNRLSAGDRRAEIRSMAAYVADMEDDDS